MNVLLTAVGRRGYLVRAFREAMRGRGRVLAANTQRHVSGMVEADAAFVVPPSVDPGYPEHILRLCREQEVGMLLSFHDLDTLVLGRVCDRLQAAGVDAILPDAEWAETCLDKDRTAVRLLDAGLPIPWHATDPAVVREAVRSGRVRLPLVVKPRYGFGSIGTRICESLDDLDATVSCVARDAARSALGPFLTHADPSAVLIQEHVAGEEHCLSLLHDLSGNPVARMVCRVKAMRAGESDVARVVDPAVLGDLPGRLSALTRHRGLWGADILLGSDGGRIIDLNPRFTGDYAFHHLAGADVPAALVAWRLGETPDPACWSPEIGVVGCKDLVPMRIPA